MDATSIISALPDSRGLPASTFDYGAMDANTAREARAIVERYRGRTRSYMMDTGRDLVAMKGRLDHGLFQRWLKAEMGLEPRTAQNFMQAAEQFGSKSEIVSHLPATVIYQLAAPSTPEPVRAAVLRRIEAGETIAPAAILDEVREAREEAKATAAAERETTRRAALSDEQREEEDGLRARGEKGRLARERKEARDRAVREVERRERDAAVTEAATALVDMLGADRAAAYFARFGDVAYAAFQRAEEVAQARRAARTMPVEVVPNDIRRSGPLYDFMAPEDRPRIEALAETIERDGLTEPPVAVRHASNRLHPIHVLDGHDTVRALLEVLHWKAIPFRLAPPVTADELAAIGAVDARA